jgi:hypothetical protein
MVVLHRLICGYQCALTVLRVQVVVNLSYMVNTDIIWDTHDVSCVFNSNYVSLGSRNVGSDAD